MSIPANILILNLMIRAHDDPTCPMPRAIDIDGRQYAIFYRVVGGNAHIGKLTLPSFFIDGRQVTREFFVNSARSVE